MIKIILAALCANLLYTNSNLMITATANLQPWAAFLMVAFALTYSLISTVAVFKVKSPVTVAVFALLDGFAVYTHLAPHDEAFPVTVAAYFGIYTTCTLCICLAGWLQKLSSYEDVTPISAEWLVENKFSVSRPRGVNFFLRTVGGVDLGAEILDNAIWKFHIYNRKTSFCHNMFVCTRGQVKMFLGIYGMENLIN